VIRRAWRGILRFLGSPTLAVGLLAFVSAWSIVATAVPQGDASVPAVIDWAAKHGSLEPLVRALALHQAFSSYIFLFCVTLLAVSTLVCSWNRTKVAIGRTRVLRNARAADSRSIAEKHDLEIACGPALTARDALTIASQSLERIGVKTKRRDEVISAVSAPWAVWGSPVFHWALFLFIVAAFVGSLQRSDGQMAVAVGQTKADAPASYLTVSAGPWHDWRGVHRSIRVDALDPDFKTGGIDRGAVPTISVLDDAGMALVTQRVYPNMKLHSGSLSINAPAVGLAATLALLDGGSNESGRLIEPVDFSQTASGGTVPVEVFSRKDAAGNVVMRLSVTVPLDRVGNHYGEWIPRQPAARVVVTSGDGTPLLDRVVHPGESVAMPGGGSIRLVGIGWYSRLSLVDDATIPFIYGAMIVAMLGLTLSLVARQQVLVATAIQGPDGVTLAMNIRVWRNARASRAEIERELTRALGGEGTGSTT
jgi:cytochrome c biogenesis protein ResB